MAIRLEGSDLDGSLLPHDSERTLGSIQKISRKISPEVFGPMLAQAVSYRLENWENGRRTGIRGTLTDLKHVVTQLATPQLPELPEPPKLMLLKAPGAETGSIAETDESDAAPHTEKRKRTRVQTVETELDDHENESNEKPANHPEKPRKRSKTGVILPLAHAKWIKKKQKTDLRTPKRIG